jgi:putative ABC transport system ATP-binding protein
VVNEPQIILADEPTGALDSMTADEIMQIFERLNISGKTVIIVTHDKDIAARCKRVIELSDGEIAKGTN